MSWEIAFGVGAAALLIALIWGFSAYKARNKANDAVTAAATEAEYDRPANYDAKEDELRRQLKP